MTLTITRGARVRVYRDPITCQTVEQCATVVKKPTPLDWADAQGRPMYRATVKFPGDSTTYERDVSELVS